MKVIYKYHLGVTPGRVVVKMPFEAKPLSVGVQDDSVVVWAEVDTDELLGGKVFELIMTGQEMPNENDFDFIGTVTLHGWYVLHVFAANNH
jgi:hypothetical protein